MGAHAEALGSAALEVLAEKGGRGFTHRAVDECAGLPTGTASRYARTRVALLAMAADVLFVADVRETAAALERYGAPVDTLDDVLEVLLGATKALMAHPQRYLARVELQLEARRAAELRQRFDDARSTFVNVVAGMLGAVGTSEPLMQADVMVSAIDGLLHRQIALEQPPLVDADVRSLLRAMASG